MATCTDDIKNQAETDVDCGGSCAPTYKCGPGAACVTDSDCATMSCTNNECDAGCGDCIKARMRQGTTNSNDAYLRPYPSLVNTGTAPIALKELEIRYYFTNDGANSNFSCTCWSAEAPASCNTVTSSVVAMSTPATGADHYIKMTFPSSTQIIQVGAEVGKWDVGCRVNPWYNWSQSADYSWWGSTTWVDWNKITVHQQGVLIWGNPP